MQIKEHFDSKYCQHYICFLANTGLNFKCCVNILILAYGACLLAVAVAVLICFGKSWNCVIRYRITCFSRLYTRSFIRIYIISLNQLCTPIPLWARLYVYVLYYNKWTNECEIMNFHNCFMPTALISLLNAQ